MSLKTVLFKIRLRDGDQVENSVFLAQLAVTLMQVLIKGITSKLHVNKNV